MNNDKILVHIKNMKTKKEFDLYVRPTDTIGSAKRIYMKEFNIPNIEYITWNIDAQILKNDKTFQSYEIEDDDLIVSIYKVVGGRS